MVEVTGNRSQAGTLPEQVQSLEDADIKDLTDQQRPGSGGSAIGQGRSPHKAASRQYGCTGEETSAFSDFATTVCEGFKA